ncbi:MAG: HEAT repeat domain-containing protein [Nitrospinae bacterium]|nr:HEAT repeat domain-containing protein [Nitrospinota bacterium]
MSLKEKLIETLIPVLKNGNEPARGYSVMALGELRAPAAVEPLIERLSTDTDPDVRAESALSLGKILSPLPLRERVRVRGEMAVNALITALKDDDAIVRINAATSLGMIKDSDTVDSLIETIKSEDYITYSVGDILAYNYQWDVQCKAIESLGEIGDERAVEPLISIVNNEYDGDPSVIFNTLGKFKNDKSLKFLIEKLKDNEPHIRRMAVRALRDFADNPLVLDALINSLLDMDSGVKIESAKVLSNYSNREKILVPLILLLKDKDKEVRREIAKIVVKIAGEKAIEHIIALLSDDDIDVRIIAVELLGDMGNKNANKGVVTKIIQALDDEDEVVMEIMSALKKLKAQESFEPILSIINDKERTREVRACAIQTISYLPFPLLTKEGKEGMSAEKYLLDMLNFDEEMKTYVIYSLGIIGSANCRSVLLSFLNDENKEVKKSAIKSLGITKSPEAVEPLLNLLNTAEKGADVDIILDIISSLCSIGDLKAVEPLIGLLKDNNPVIRRQCIITLGVLKDKRATNSLISVLKDEDAAVRREAVIALGNIGDNRAVEPLISALFESERFIDIRADISKSLKKIGDSERTVNMLIDAINDSNKTPFHWLALESIGEIYKNEAIA